MECSRSIMQLQRAFKSAERVDCIFSDAEKWLPKLLPIFEKYIEDHRQIIYFLILNSDHGFSDQLSSEFTVGLLINTIPTLEIAWTVNISLLLGAEKFLLEIVQYGRDGIVISLVREILRSIDCKSHWKFYQLLGDILIWKIKQATKNGTVSESLVRCLSVVIKKIGETAKTFLLSTEREESGKIVLGFFELTLSAIGCDSLPSNSELKEFYYLKGNYAVDNDNLIEYELSMNLLLFFEELKEFLKLINFDIWISWADTLLPDKDTCLQTLIGNAIFEICEKIEAFNLPKPDEIWQCLNCLKISPLTTEQLIENSSLKTIIKTVEENEIEEIEKWYSALFGCEEAWRDPQTVSLILSKVKLVENPGIVFEKYVDLLQTEDAVLLQNYLQALNELDTVFQPKLLEKICLTQEIWRFHPRHNTNLGIDKMVEEFNKFSSSTSVDDFFKIIFHSLIEQPVEVIRKIFEFAMSVEENTVCVKVLHLAKSVLDVTNFKDPVSEIVVSDMTLLHYVSDLLLLRESFNDMQYCSLIKFFASLATAGVLPKTFIKTFLLPALEKSVLETNWTLFQRLFELFESIFGGLYAEDDSITPLLAFLAQLLSETSWDALSFDLVKVEAHDMVAKTVSKLLEEQMCHLTDVDVKFLRSFLDGYPELVKTHFASVWFREEANVRAKHPGGSESYTMLLVILRSKPVHGMKWNPGLLAEDHTEFFSALVQVLPFIHPWEWEAIEEICSRRINGGEPPEDIATATAFSLIAEALSIVATCLNPTLIPLFERCMKNFSYLFDSHLSNLPESTYCKLLYHFILPLSRLRDETVRNKLYILNVPLMRSAYNQGLIYADNLDALERLLCMVDRQWQDKIQNCID